MGFPGGSDSKESSCSVEDVDLFPGLRRSPGEGHGNSLQYSPVFLPGESPWIEEPAGLQFMGNKEQDMIE